MQEKSIAVIIRVKKMKSFVSK